MIKNCYNCKHWIDLRKISICEKWGVQIHPDPYLFCEKWEHDNLHDDDAKERSE